MEEEFGGDVGESGIFIVPEADIGGTPERRPTADDVRKEDHFEVVEAFGEGDRGIVRGEFFG